MRNLLLAGVLAAVAIPAGPLLAQNQDYHHDQRDDDRADHHGGPGDRDHRQDGRGGGRQDFRRYDYNNPDPRYGNYRPDRYYRPGKARRLSANDRIYRGSDNRYYCRHDDGTTGLIVGGLGGGVLGNVIAPGDSKTLGTILGAGAGALLGRSIDRNNITCR